jgi:hypothetical protein
VQVQAQAAPVVASVKPGQSAQLTKAGWVIPATYGSPVKA